MKYDKQFNTEFYGTRPVNDLKWTRENETEPFALRVPYNDYGYLWENSPFKPTHWAQPLDPSIALWSIQGDCCFASRRCTIVSQASGSTLSIDITESDTSEPLPLALNARDFGSFSSSLIARLAYDITDVTPQFNPDCYALYDISYKDVVIAPDVTFYDYNDEQTSNFNSLSSAKTYLDSHLGTDNFVMCYLVSGILMGTDVTINNRDSYIPAKGEPDQYLGSRFLVADVLADFTIPDNEYIKYAFHQSNPWETYDPDRRDDVAYFPFYFAYSNRIFDMYHYDPNILRLYAGYYTSFTNNEIVLGYVYLPPSSEHAVSGFTSRMSTTNREFEDVSYHWEDAIYNEYADEFANDGYEMTGEPTYAKYVFMSKLVIDETKGHSMSESIINAIKHEYAFFGFYFADDATTAQTKVTGSETDGIGLYLPNRTFNIPDGTYVTGEDIADSPFADLDTTEGLAPSNPDDETYTDSTPDLNNTIITASTVHLYAQVPIETLIENLNAIPTYDGEDTLEIYNYFFGANPYEFILGYYITPKFFIPQWYISEYLQHPDVVALGKYECDNRYGAPAPVAYAVQLKTPLRREFILPVMIEKLFDNFLDYEPYSTLSLYLPFVGTIDLPPSVFVGHHISVNSSFDLISGMVTYFIYSDRIQYTTVSALARIDLPFHGRDISDYSRNMLSAYTERNATIFNMISNIGSTIGRAGTSAAISSNKLNDTGIATSLIGGTLSTIGDLGTSLVKANMYNTILTKSSPNPTTISMGSVADGFANTLTPYIIRNTPEYKSGFETDVFAATFGFACYINFDYGELSDYHGFTVIENPILDNIPISAKEKEMLRKILSEGVILP